MKHKLPLLSLIWFLTIFIAYLSGKNIPNRLGLACYLSLFLGFSCLTLFLYARLRRRKAKEAEKGYFTARVFPFFGLFVILLAVVGFLSAKPLHSFQGDIYKNEGRYREAISEYQQGSPENLDSRLSEVYLLAGDQQLATSNYKEALDWYFKVFATEPDSSPVNRRVLGTYILQGANLTQTNNFSGAISSYEKALPYLSPGGKSLVVTTRLTLLPPVSSSEIYARLETSYSRLGDQYLKKGDFELAVKSYKQALHLNLNSESLTSVRPRELISKQLSATYLAWGQDLEGQNQADGQSLEKVEDQVLAKYEAVINSGFNPQAENKAYQWSAAIIFRKGDRELAAGNFEKAIQLYQRTVDQYETSPTYLKIYLSKTYLAWGKKLLAEGNWEGALAKLEPNYLLYAYSYDSYAYLTVIIDNYLGIGNNLLTDKKYNEAISRLESAFTSYPKAENTDRLHSLLGRAYLGQAAEFEAIKDYQGAVYSYQKALVLGQERSLVSPGLIRGYITLGNEAFAQKKFELASNHYLKAQDHALNFGDSSTYVALSQKLSNISNIQRGQRDLNFYLAKGSEFEATGSYRQAIESYEQALVYTSITSDFATRYDLYLRLLGLYSNLGQQLAEKDKNYSEAADSFEQGLFYAQLLDNNDAKTKFSFQLVTMNLAEMEEISSQLEEAGQEQARLENETKLTLAEAGLVGCSFLPAVGVFCDIGSGAFSVWQGDLIGAGLSLIGAIPFLGDLLGGGAKAAKISGKLLALEQKLTKLKKVLDNGRRLVELRAEKFIISINRAEKVKWKGPVKIHLEDPPTVGQGKDFTQLQKQKILEENKLRNGGVLRSDCSGKILVPSLKLVSGVAANLYAAEVDHIQPKSLEGSNSYDNAQVLSKEENQAKGNKNLVCPLFAP